MDLRKWRSNAFSSSEKTSGKVLGVTWDVSLENLVMSGPDGGKDEEFVRSEHERWCCTGLQ